jgi:hypothetical protein
MKDSRQRILDKLAKTRSVKKAKLNKLQVKLNKIDEFKEAFNVDTEGEVTIVLRKLNDLLDQANTQANLLIEIGEYAPEYLDLAINMRSELEDILGESPEELTDFIDDTEAYLERVADFGYATDSAIADVWDSIPEYI